MCGNTKLETQLSIIYTESIDFRTFRLTNLFFLSSFLRKYIIIINATTNTNPSRNREIFFKIEKCQNWQKSFSRMFSSLIKFGTKENSTRFLPLDFPLRSSPNRRNYYHTTRCVRWKKIKTRKRTKDRLGSRFADLVSAFSLFTSPLSGGQTNEARCI